MMMHWILTEHDASRLVEDLRAGRPREDLRRVAGDGADSRPGTETFMKAFRESVDEIRAGSSRAASGGTKSTKGADERKDQVEGKLSCVLFEGLKDLEAAVLTDPGFWRYLAVWEMFDFVQWRDGENCKLVSFGAGSHSPTWDCVPKRMFVRARIAFEADGDGNWRDLAGIAGTDVWRSHVLRVKTGNSPALSAALLEAWDDQVIRTKEVRDVAKRIKRLRSNMVFELMDVEQIDAILSRQIEAARGET